MATRRPDTPEVTVALTPQLGMTEAVSCPARVSLTKQNALEQAHLARRMCPREAIPNVGKEVRQVWIWQMHRSPTKGDPK